MQHNGKSIRPFIGSKDFNLSRKFYSDLGFKENVLSHNLSVFHSGPLSFYLQDYYAKEWVDNTMIFMEVDDVHRFWDALVALDLPSKFPNVRIVPIKHLDWGKECFLHDPSGILWHFGEFK
jgi:catechol 2,3-dioxygenase-like lactoylglutathione lyase family enzyme